MIDPAGVARAQSKALSRSDAARVVGVLGVLADPVRLRLICALDASQEL